MRSGINREFTEEVGVTLVHPDNQNKDCEFTQHESKFISTFWGSPRNDPRPGDQIKVFRSGGYWHHGVYIWSDEVIHVNGEVKAILPGADEVKVVETSLQRFLDDSDAPTVVEYKSGCDSKEKAINRAKSKAGQKWDYGVAMNNCEHFATWCKTGKQKSSQVRKVGSAAGGIIAAAAGAIYREELGRLGRKAPKLLKQVTSVFA